MSYHRFPILGEIIQGDLVGKIRKGFGSKDFIKRECNFNSTAKVKGTFAYGSEYRACFVS